MIKKFNNFINENNEWDVESISTDLYKENNHSKLIFIQDNMNELSTEALEEMIDIIKREVPEEDLISNDHPRVK